MKQIIWVSLLAAGSCKPYARDPQGVIKASDGSKIFTVKLEREGDKNQLLVCAAKELSECHNPLLAQDGQPYAFRTPEAVFSQIEGNKKKRSAIKQGLLLGAGTVAAGLMLLGIKKPTKLLDKLAELKGKIKAIMEAKIEELPDAEIAKWEEDFHDSLDNLLARVKKKGVGFSDRDGKLADDIVSYFKDIKDSLERGNFVAAEMGFEEIIGNIELLYDSGLSQAGLLPVIIAGLAAVPATLLASFAHDMHEDRKLQQQSEHILALFIGQSKEISLSFDELMRLLKIFSKYLPVKIDKEWLERVV